MDGTKLIFKNYLDVFPTSKMSSKEKILALIRLFFYLTIIGVLVFRRLGILFFVIMVVMVIVYYSIRDEERMCYRSTIDNPAMNVTYIDNVKNPNRKVACDEDITNNLRYNLYENEMDIYMTRNQERIFYTQPVTTIINDQDKYLDFLYDVKRKTCKEDRKCI
jgi:hypothetical protein